MYNPKVVQSTMASLARVHVSYHELGEILPTLHRPLIAATLGGSDLDGFEKSGRGTLLIGNESKGISSALQLLANHNITIPRKGKAESLNAAVATGILLYGLMK
jgi:TrmH family RNA methyltransferase